MRGQTSHSHSESVPIHFVRQHQHLAQAGELRDAIYQIQEGWACRYRLMRDGRRQITGLFLPGDYCEPQWLLGPRVHHPIMAISNVRAISLPIADLVLAAPRSEKGQAIAAALLANLDRQSDWIISLGRKTAMERISSLFVELFERMRGVGLAYGDQCALPLTQTDLADMTGLTPVHVNRVLRELRAMGLVELHSRWLRLPDLPGLRRMGSLPASAAEAKTVPAPEAAPSGPAVLADRQPSHRVPAMLDGAGAAPRLATTA